MLGMGVDKRRESLLLFTVKFVYVGSVPMQRQYAAYDTASARLCLFLCAPCTRYIRLE